MPLGYVLVAVCTAAALLAPRHPRPLAVAASHLGHVVAEVPQLGALFLAGTTALAALEDDLTGVAGVVAIGVAGATLVGLGVLARRGMRAPGVVDAALRDAGVGPARRRSPLARPLVAPLPVRPRSVERIRDVRYGPDRAHRLDVYRRRAGTTGAPVLLYLHGGGYSSGSKHWEGRALLHRLASQGWVCLSAHYRLRPRADFPDHLDDARRALAWARHHAARYGADPQTVVLAGSSAGAHLTALCALGGPDRDTPDAAVCLYGYYGRYYGRGAREHPVSTPLALDASTAPPTFVAHGDHDTYVPVEGARAFVAHVRRSSARPVAYAELPGGHHAFDLFRSWRGAAVVDGVEHFLTRTLTKETTPSAS